MKFFKLTIFSLLLFLPAIAHGVHPVAGKKLGRFLLSGIFSAFFLFLFVASPAYGADRFWVGGTGNWSDDDNHWATVSGGTPANGNVPTSSDNVFFDSASHTTDYTVTVDSDANCADMTWANPASGSPSVTLNSGLNIYGSSLFVSGMTFSSGSQTIYFRSSATGRTITTNNVVLTNTYVNFNNTNGGWTLQDSLTVGYSIVSSGGIFDTNGQTVTCGNFTASGSTARTLTLGSSTLNISGNFDFSGTNQTLTANTATINMTGASKQFNGVGTQTWGGTINFTGGGTSYISQGTYANLSIVGTASKTDKFYFSSSSNTTISNSLTVAGNSAVNRLLIYSGVQGTSRTITSNGTNTFSNVDFQDITGAGTASWDLSAITGLSGDAGGNSGITFTPAQTQYWHVGTGSWSTAGNWFTATNGGGSAGRVPLPQDDVVFDASSTDGASTITVDMPRLGKALNFSAVNDATTVNFGSSVQNSIFGSLTLGASITPGGTSYGTTFENRAPATITSAGRTFTNTLAIICPGTSITLGDSIIITKPAGNAFILAMGIFDAAGYNVTSYGFDSSYTYTRSLIMGSGIWTINGTSSTQLWDTNITNLTFNSTGSSLVFTGNGGDRTFRGRNLTFNIVKFTNTGTGYYLVTGANTANYQFEPNAKVKFPSGVTQTVTGFSGNGTAGNLVTITSSTPGSPFTLSKTSGTISVDYFSIQDSAAIGGARWYAGLAPDHSTNVSGNTGWVFTAVPLGNVFYSVGKTTNNLMTGTPNVSITSGVATFTGSAQTGNIGVGDRLTAGGNVYYLSGKTSTSVWNVVNKLGVAPADLASTAVTSILREYTSLSAAEAGVADSNHLNDTDLVTGNYILNLACYYDTGADTTAVTIDGWTTGASNYIKIYTPNNTATEANTNQRHAGKWDEGKYRMVATPSNYSSVIMIKDNYVRIDGLQINIINAGGDYCDAVGMNFLGANNEIWISGNIIKGTITTTASNGIVGYSGNEKTKIWNNIIYDFSIGSGLNPTGAGGGPSYIYNNTLQNNASGIVSGSSGTVAKNNIVKGSGNSNAYVGTFAADTDYNATEGTDNIGQGSNNRISQTFTFIDEANDDFHLATTDLGARGYGLSQYSDANLPVTIDIDGHARRPNGEVTDIGADEDIDTLDGATVRVSSIKESGARYATLSAWEADRDGDITNYYPEVAQIDGAWTTPDTTAVTINDWTTDATHYIKVYTTDAARHGGKWDEGKYRLSVSNTNGVWNEEDYVRFDGLQISLTAVNSNYSYPIICIHPGTAGEIQISNNIIKGVYSGTSDYLYGIRAGWIGGGSQRILKIWNNAIYDIINSSYANVGAISLGANFWTAYIYNNTIHNSYIGISSGGNNTIAKNNIVKGSGDVNAYVGTFAAGTDYNATDGTDAIGQGSNNRISQTFTFVDEVNKDFHLASNDAGAKNHGANLLADANLAITNDIDGDGRLNDDDLFDIGADEAQNFSQKIKGTIKVKGQVKFK